MASLKDKVIQWVLNKTIEGIPIDTVRKRLYDKVVPVTYDNPYFRFRNAVKGNSDDVDLTSWQSALRDDIWAEYLGIPKNKRHSLKDSYYNITSVVDSKYKPTKTNSNNNYKALDDNTINRHTNSKGEITYDQDKNSLARLLIEDAFGHGRRRSFTDYTNTYIDDRAANFDKILNIGENKISGVLEDFFATHTIGRGLDPNNGEYVSYYDLWDIAPIGDTNSKDESNGIGKPVEFYDRIYLDDYYGIPKANRYNRRMLEDGIYYGGWLPEVIVQAKSKRKK